MSTDIPLPVLFSSWREGRRKGAASAHRTHLTAGFEPGDRLVALLWRLATSDLEARLAGQPEVVGIQVFGNNALTARLTASPLSGQHHCCRTDLSRVRRCFRDMQAMDCHSAAEFASGDRLPEQG